MEKKVIRVVVGDIETNCWLYLLEEESSGQRSCVIIDPGDEAALIVSRLRELNWVPRWIFLTHGHFDHLAALPDLLDACGGFPGPLPGIGIHRLDAHYLGKNALAAHRSSLAAAGANPAYVDALWKALPEADLLFEEGDAAGPFRVLHLPGHTPGSVGFYDELTGSLFSRDTLFRGNWGRTDLPGGNEARIYQSLRRILSMQGDIAVYPGHGPETTIKEEAGLLGS